MKKPNDQMIYEALMELSNRDVQISLWIPHDRNKMGSLVEAVESLYSDSGLGDELDRGRQIYDPAIDGRLSTLRKLLKSIKQTDSVEETISSPNMEKVRLLAREILTSLTPYLKAE